MKKKMLPGALNALVENIMRQTGTDDPSEAIRLINSGVWMLTKSVSEWREEDGVIYFTVKSDGTTGEDWISRLESRGFHVHDCAKQILRSPDFKPTSGAIIEVAVLKSPFKNNGRITKKIGSVVYKRKLLKSNAELACLIRDKFTDKDLEAMGLSYITTMHKPIKNNYSVRLLLGVSRNGRGRSLNARFKDAEEGMFDHGSGFAFEVSKHVLKAK